MHYKPAFFLVKHPLLVRELGFRLVVDTTQPYGIDVARSVPSERWLRHKQQTLPNALLQALFEKTVHALQAGYQNWVKQSQSTRSTSMLGSRKTIHVNSSKPAMIRRNNRVGTLIVDWASSGAATRNMRMVTSPSEGIPLGLRLRRRGCHRSGLWRCSFGGIHHAFQ